MGNSLGIVPSTFVWMSEEVSRAGERLILERSSKILTTDIWETALLRILRYPTILEAGLVRPFVCLFSFPGPHEPAHAFLIGSDLSFPILPHEVFVVLAESRCFAGETLAAANFVISECTIEATSFSTTVEVRCAVIAGRSPFTDYGPKRGADEVVSVIAHILDELILTHLVTLSESQFPNKIDEMVKRVHQRRTSRSSVYQGRRHQIQEMA